MLPGGTANATEATTFIDEWVARVNDAYGYTPAPESALTRAIVRTGAFGDLLRLVLVRSGNTETPAADAATKRAEMLLADYDKQYSSPDEWDSGYMGELVW